MQPLSHIMDDCPFRVRPGEQAAQAGTGAVDRRDLGAVGDLAMFLPVEQVALQHQGEVEREAMALLPPRMNPCRSARIARRVAGEGRWRHVHTLR